MLSPENSSEEYEFFRELEFHMLPDWSSHHALVGTVTSVVKRWLVEGVFAVLEIYNESFLTSSAFLRSWAKRFSLGAIKFVQQGGS